MGGNISTQEQKSISKMVNNITNQAKATVNNELNMKMISNLTINITIGKGAVMNCGKNPLNVTLTSQSISEGYLEAQSKFSSDFASQLENDINNKLNTQLHQQNSGINLPSVNQSDTQQTIENYTKNNVKNIVEQTINNIAKGYDNKKQTINFTLEGTLNADGCNFSNSNFEKMALSNISDTISNGIFNALVANKDINTEKSVVSQKNLGIFGGLLALVVVICIVGCVVIGGRGMITNSKGNNQDNYQDDSYYQDDSQGVEMSKSSKYD